MMRNTGACVLGLLLAAAATAPAQKRSVAVQDFDYSAVMTEVQSIFGTHVDIGRGINALMVKRVAQAGKFTVVNKVDKLMGEQDFAQSGRVKKGTGPRTGQIRGAELTLMGDIVVFGRDDRKKSGVAGVGTAGGGVVAGGYKKGNKAVVVLTYRLVDNESSEIVASGEARGESVRESKGFGAAFLLGGVFGGGAFDISSSNFAQTIIGEAVMDACDKLGADLDGRAASVGTRQLDIEAHVADVSGSSITITAGSSAGLSIGDKLTVYRLGKAIKDPVSGEVLDQSSEPIGQMVVVQVRERIAVGSFNGAVPPKVGDAARSN